MLSKRKIIFTLEPSDTHTAEQYEANYHKYNDFLSSLSKDAADEVQNAILKTARYVIETSKKRNYNYDNDISEYLQYIDRIDKDGYIPNELKLLERVYSVKDKYHVPINSWKINTVVVMVKLCKHLISSGMNMTVMYNIDGDLPKTKMSSPDITKIVKYFNLLEILKNLYKYINHDINYVNYVRAYNHYLFEYYRRSNNPDFDIIAEYKGRSKLCTLEYLSGRKSCEGILRFDVRIDMSNNIEQNITYLEETFNSIKFYIKRTHQASYVEDWYLSKTGGGKKHFKEQFRKWDRYLRIFDLYKKYLDQGKVMTKRRIDDIGKVIVAELDWYSTSDIYTVRSHIENDYKEALRLIKQSAEGYLS